MKPIEIHAEARADWESAINFYESQQIGLGQDFHAEAQRVLQIIGESPQIGAPYRSTRFRFQLLRRFPYVVFYTETTDAIWIMAFAHGRRRPGYWRGRKAT